MPFILHRQALFVLVHPHGASFVNHPLRIHEHDALTLYPPADGKFGTGNCGSPRARDDQSNILVLLADDFQRICQTGR